MIKMIFQSAKLFSYFLITLADNAQFI